MLSVPDALVDIPHVLGLSEIILIVHELHSVLSVDELGDLLPLVRYIYGTPVGEINRPLSIMAGHPGALMYVSLEPSFHHSKLA